ncbi:MAG: hypothetical protein SVR08_00095 [Spirochaetota bacterium]|nr:hypothetical protein [Spirochaetota bacterium]
MKAVFNRDELLKLEHSLKKEYLFFPGIFEVELEQGQSVIFRTSIEKTSL